MLTDGFRLQLIFGNFDAASETLNKRLIILVAQDLKLFVVKAVSSENILRHEE